MMVVGMQHDHAKAGALPSRPVVSSTAWRSSSKRPGPACVLLVAWAVASACASSQTQPPCRVGADCASGACYSDGTCAPVDAGVISRSDGHAQDGVATQDGPGGDSCSEAGCDGAAHNDTVTASDDEGDGPSTGTCAPNHDGQIAFDEVPLRAGLYATYRIASQAMVNTAGEMQSDGSRKWDLSGMLDNDHDVRVEALPVEGAWYANDFVGATYAVKLSDSQDLLGVFERSTAGLLLRGVVSPEDGATRTRLVYDPPVTVLQFPFKLNDSWSTHSTVTGEAVGVPSVYTESYESRVAQNGELITPFGTFSVLRVTVRLDRTVGLLTTTVRQHAFVSECFGTVATIVSQDNETNDEFSSAAEVRRLAP